MRRLKVLHTQNRVRDECCIIWLEKKTPAIVHFDKTVLPLSTQITAKQTHPLPSNSQTRKGYRKGVTHLKMQNGSL